MRRIGVKSLGIADAEFTDLRLGSAFAREKIAAIGKGQKIHRLPLDDLEPVPMELEIADNFRV